MGFCRTNLFKRLESSGSSFLQSVRRHIHRNFIFLHAIEHNLPLPIGTQDAALFDTSNGDADNDSASTGRDFFEGDAPAGSPDGVAHTLAEFKKQGQAAYELLHQSYRPRFDWLRPDVFATQLAKDLEQDAKRLISILELAGVWQPAKDAKLAELTKLLTKTHPKEKILIFRQFPSAQCEQRHFGPAGISGREKSRHSRSNQENQQNHQRRGKWRNLQVTAPEVPVGGFVGFCPSSFTVSAVFHRTGGKTASARKPLKNKARNACSGPHNW
jgi:hypothetical protein